MKDEAIAKLANTTASVWEAAIRQAPWQSAFELVIFTGILFVFVLMATPHNWRLIRSIANDHGWDWDFFGGIYVALASVLLVAILAFFACMPLLLSGFFNPEYWALKQIVK